MKKNAKKKKPKQKHMKKKKSILFEMSQSSANCRMHLRGASGIEKVTKSNNTVEAEICCHGTASGSSMQAL